MTSPAVYYLHMEMQIVESSLIHSVGHDPDTSKMRVKFHSGATYEYDGVSESDHAAFVTASSVGKHFGNHIRGTFKSRKL